MPAGDVFDNVPVQRRLKVFRLIYAVLGAMNFRGWLSELGARRRQTTFTFSGGNAPVDAA